MALKKLGVYFFGEKRGGKESAKGITGKGEARENLSNLFRRDCSRAAALYYIQTEVARSAKTMWERCIHFFINIFILFYLAKGSTQYGFNVVKE